MSARAPLGPPPPLRDDVLAAVRVPATSANLGSGFDALGIALDRHLVAMAVPRGDRRVVTTGEGAHEVSDGDDNLVWACLVRFCQAHDVLVPDVSLEVCNAIPLERGLGSSSAAIVAGLTLGRHLTASPVGSLALVALATEIEGHPDNVAPALLGGFVACTTGDDGDLVVRRVQPDPTAAIVVAVPAGRQNTNEARGVLPDALSRSDVVVQASRAVHVAGAMTGTWPADPNAVGDLLHEPPRFRVMTESAGVVTAWRRAGLPAWLSGAGPTVAARVPAADPGAIATAVAIATDAGFETMVLGWDLSGALVCAAGGCGVSGQQGCLACPRRGLC